MLSCSEHFLTQILGYKSRDTEFYCCLFKSHCNPIIHALIHKRHMLLLYCSFLLKKKKYMEKMSLALFHLHGNAKHEAF